MKQHTVTVIFFAIVLGILAGITTLKWLGYKQRFPHGGVWGFITEK